jgi:hypothetical protein
MKNAIVIALALVSVAAFAGTKVTKEARKAAVEACKAEGKTKKDLKACVKEKTAAPAAEAKMETAPAAAPAPAAK